VIDYNKAVSFAAQSIAPSGIRKFFDILEEMPDAIKLGVGEPDFITPWHIRDAGIRSLEKGFTKYTSNAGHSQLRQEISAYLNRRFSLTYSAADEILITVGGSEAIDIAVRTLVNPGDEVIIPVPSFVCYGPVVTLARGVPVYVETKAENEFRLTARELRGAITERTKLVVLPFPNNPTGAILEKADLESLAEVLRGTEIMVLTDEIYAELTYGQDHVSFASIPDMRERTIVASGFSKAYSMTGWRLGYVCAPEPITKQMTKLHQYAIMCAPTTSQYAAIEAMRNGDEDVLEMREEYDRRRVLMLGGLRKIGIECFEPKGAFYMFPSLKKFGLSSEEFCERLLLEQKVAIVPGNAFGAGGEGFARMCYAASQEAIKEALIRIKAFTESL